jgi:hypothetical protein
MWHFDYMTIFPFPKPVISKRWNSSENNLIGYFEWDVLTMLNSLKKGPFGTQGNRELIAWRDQVILKRQIKLEMIGHWIDLTYRTHSPRRPGQLWPLSNLLRLGLFLLSKKSPTFYQSISVTILAFFIFKKKMDANESKFHCRNTSH